LFFPDLGAEQRLLAGSGKRASLCHAETDLDRFTANLREGRRPRQGMRDQGRTDASIDMPPRDAMGHEFPP